MDILEKVTNGAVIMFLMPSEKHAKEFLEWLENEGEQDYWGTMEMLGKQCVLFDVDYHNFSVNCEVSEREE